MHTEILSYEADGLLMQSHLYFEDGPLRRPGILVFPEARCPQKSDAVVVDCGLL
jgi:hypothetical protein